MCPVSHIPVRIGCAYSCSFPTNRKLHPRIKSKRSFAPFTRTENKTPIPVAIGVDRFRHFHSTRRWHSIEIAIAFPVSALLECVCVFFLCVSVPSDFSTQNNQRSQCIAAATAFHCILAVILTWVLLWRAQIPITDSACDELFGSVIFINAHCFRVFCVPIRSNSRPPEKLLHRPQQVIS